MNGFVCVITPWWATGATQWRADMDGVARARFGRPHRWSIDGACAIAIVNSGIGQAPGIERWEHITAVGIVRLDDADRVAAMTKVPPQSSHLYMATVALSKHGPKALDSLYGELAMVWYDHRQRTAWVVRDALGMQGLFSKALPDNVVALASHGSLLSESGQYDREYLAEFLVGSTMTARRSIFANVDVVLAGHIGTVANGALTCRPYWQPDQLTHLEPVDSNAAITTFRELLERGVRSCLLGSTAAWSYLSGGQDSSSIVVVAKYLHERGLVDTDLRGTLTIVDTLSKRSDERIYSRAVSARTGIRGTEVSALDWMYDDGEAPPHTDEPSVALGFYARNRLAYRTLLNAGATTVLSGLGADHYLSCKKPLFIADLVARGRMMAAARLALVWAVATRNSFWRTAYKRALLPLLPNALRQLKQFRREEIPRWLTPSFGYEMNLGGRLTKIVEYDVPRGHMYGNYLARGVRALGAHVRQDRFGDAVSVRYPFLYRPLLDFSLRLPFWLCAHPTATKWILRQSTADLLPPEVRDRREKSTIGARVRQSFVRQWEAVDYLLEDPMLGDLGCIDAEPLRRMLRRVAQGSSMSISGIQRCLALELWLRVDSGRWAAKSDRTRAARKVG